MKSRREFNSMNTPNWNRDSVFYQDIFIAGSYDTALKFGAALNVFEG
ncbi:MAG: hypothetical protein SGI87_04495 [Flavobacteriales bacterium]|nr:hypothetical protein [Flavobacteriales bacterium]